MRVAGARVLVQMRVPVTALADATLPRLPDGTLDMSALADPLRIVAADAVRNLDVLQNGAALAQTAFESRLSPDRASIEVDVTYAARGTTGLSARLNTFAGTSLHPVRTTVEYVSASGRSLTVSVTGQPRRVDFEPTAGATAALFTRQTLRSLLSAGDHLLLLTCLLLPVRSPRDAARLVAVAVGGQAVGMLLYVAWPTALAPSVTTAGFVAASAVVIAALQVIVGARSTFVTGLAAAFGVMFGIGLGHALAGDLQLAGRFQWLAVLTTLSTVVVAQVWMGAVMWAARSWLDGRGVPAYPLALFFAVLVAHSAVHHVMSSAQAVGEKGSFLANHAIVLLATAWVALMLATALVDALRSGSLTAGPTQTPYHSVS
jgi:hypothetical protein